MINVTIFDDSENAEVWLLIRNRLISLIEGRGYILKEYRRDECKIKSCLACNSCWIKTPGVCCIRDKAFEMSKIYRDSDVVLFVSKIYFGSYSPWIKAVLERLLPNILPYFENRNKRMYHQLRNHHYPICIFIGIVENGEKQKTEETLFQKLVYDNTVNMLGNTNSRSLVLAMDAYEIGMSGLRYIWENIIED